MITPILRRSRPQSGPSRGFTLTELLVVIAIIGILAAILIPVIGRARARANSSVCLANLRQIAGAATLYSSDNKNRLVPIANGTGAADAFMWRGLLAPYLGQSPDLQVLRCPSDVSTMVVDRIKYMAPPSYGINNTSGLHDYLRGTYGQSDFTGKANRFSVINNPGHTIFVSDIGNAVNAGVSPENWEQKPATGNYGYATFPQDAAWPAANNYNAFPRHNGYVNVAFYDGHVQSVHVVRDLINHPLGDPLCLYKNQ